MPKQDVPISVLDALSYDPNAINQLGAAIGMAMAQANFQMKGQTLPQFSMGDPSVMMKEVALGNPSTANIYGRYSIFDPCQTGDIFGLQVATHGFPNWLGFRPNKFYSRRVGFITWWGPEGTVACTNVTGAGNPCDDPLGWEYGKCAYQLVHTSWYHRQGENLGPHEVVQDRCETTPRYRLNGKLITDDVEWQMNGIFNVLQQDLRRDLIHGSHLNAFQMDGLEALIREGYTDIDRPGASCPQVDAIMVDWVYDDLDGAVNGYGNFFDYLDEVVTEIEWRASAIGGIAEKDMILLTSRFMATCLLDAYACYTTCGVTTLSDVTDQALRAQQRQARRDLNGGPLYDGRVAVGYIHLKSGRRLPIIVEDAMDITKPNANYCTDIYLLTRRIGSQDVLYGEYLDMRVYENRIKRHDPKFRARADAAGRFVWKGKEDNWCHLLMVGTSPEMYLSAPWAQARFSDVCCSRQRQPLVGDPHQKTYLPGGKPIYEASVDL